MCKRLLREINTCKQQHTLSSALSSPAFSSCAKPACDTRCRVRKRWDEHIALLGAEAKALGRDFIVRLLKSGVKPSISGDLWSEGGMGLFGIYAHGITETWVISEKALIGLVACASERHTAENTKKWTTEALNGIGLNAQELLQAKP